MVACPDARARWVEGIRRRNAALQDALVATIDYDAHWGEVGDEHRRFVERFLARLPPRGTVLDAACGTGKYFGVVLRSGRFVRGVDHSGAMLAAAAAKLPLVPTQRLDLQELSRVAEFDGVMCVDAMEGLPPEDWPLVLGNFHRALRRGGWLYVTVELDDAGRATAVDEEARAAGSPVTSGEWTIEPDGYYHFYPGMERARAWLAEAGFTIAAEAQGPWEEGYAYHHVLARAEPRAG